MGRRPRIEDWVSPAFIAKRLNLSKPTIMRHIRAGNIEAYPSRIDKNGKLNGYRIKRAEVERLDRFSIRPRVHNFDGRKAS